MYFMERSFVGLIFCMPLYFLSFLSIKAQFLEKKKKQKKKNHLSLVLFISGHKCCKLHAHKFIHRPRLILLVTMFLFPPVSKLSLLSPLTDSPAIQDNSSRRKQIVCNSSTHLFGSYSPGSYAEPSKRFENWCLLEASCNKNPSPKVYVVQHPA